MAKLGCSAENAPPITLLRALGSGGAYTPAPHSHWLRAAPRQVRPVRSTGKVGSGGQRKPSGTEMQRRAFCGWGSSRRDLKQPGQGDSQNGTRTAGLTASLPASPDPFSPQHCRSAPTSAAPLCLRPSLPSAHRSRSGAPYSESKLPLPRSVHVPHHKGAGAGPDLAPLPQSNSPARWKAVSFGSLGDSGIRCDRFLQATFSKALG